MIALGVSIVATSPVALR